MIEIEEKYWLPKEVKNEEQARRWLFAQCVGFKAPSKDVIARLAIKYPVLIECLDSWASKSSMPSDIKTKAQFWSKVCKESVKHD